RRIKPLNIARARFAVGPDASDLRAARNVATLRGPRPANGIAPNLLSTMWMSDGYPLVCGRSGRASAMRSAMVRFDSAGRARGDEWRREQDSNLRGFPPTVFKTAALNRSAIPPCGPLYRWHRHEPRGRPDRPAR